MNRLEPDMNLTANRIRNLQKLNIGSLSNHIKREIVETAISDRDAHSVSFPYESLLHPDREMLEAGGFQVVLKEGIGEWEVVW